MYNDCNHFCGNNNCNYSHFLLQTIYSLIELYSYYLLLIIEVIIIIIIINAKNFFSQCRTCCALSILSHNRESQRDKGGTDDIPSERYLPNREHITSVRNSSGSSGIYLLYFFFI